MSGQGGLDQMPLIEGKVTGYPENRDPSQSVITDGMETEPLAVPCSSLFDTLGQHNRP